MFNAFLNINICLRSTICLPSSISEPSSTLKTLSLQDANMKATVLTLFLSLAGSISAAPTASSYVVHEKRDQIHQARGNSQVRRDTILPVAIALKQSNLENGYDYLMEVAHPDSPKYGQHWTAEQVNLSLPTHNILFTASMSLINIINLIEHTLMNCRLPKFLHLAKMPSHQSNHGLPRMVLMGTKLKYPKA